MSEEPMPNEEINAEIDAARLERRYRVLVARQSRIRAAIEQLQAEARTKYEIGFEREWANGVSYAVSTILAAIEEEVRE